MSLPRTAEAAVIRNLSLGGSTGDSNNETLAHYIQINLKSSGNIVVQGETRSFTVSDLEKFKGSLAVIGDPSSSQTLSTPLIVLLAVILVLVALASALFFVRRHKYKCSAAEKGHEAANGGAVHFGNGSRIEMYGEIAPPESSAENLLGDAPMAAATPIPEWPEPPPQWPEPGKMRQWLILLRRRIQIPFPISEENDVFLPNGHFDRRTSKNSIGSSWSSLLNAFNNATVPSVTSAADQSVRSSILSGSGGGGGSSNGTAPAVAATTRPPAVRVSFAGINGRPGSAMRGRRGSEIS